MWVDLGLYHPQSILNTEPIYVSAQEKQTLFLRSFFLLNFLQLLNFEDPLLPPLPGPLKVSTTLA